MQEKSNTYSVTRDDLKSSLLKESKGFRVFKKLDAILSSLVNAKQIERIRRDEYRLTDAGKHFLHTSSHVRSFLYKAILFIGSIAAIVGIIFGIIKFFIK